MTLKSGWEVTQGHWKWHNSIDCVWFTISVLCNFVPKTRHFWDIQLQKCNLSRDRSWNQNLRLHTKFHWNRIPGWDINDKPFSKWRPSAILNYRNLLLWSCALCLSVILLLHTKFRVNRTINRWNLAKIDFQYGGRPPFWICKILTFCHVTTLETKICIGIPNFIQISLSAAEILR